MMMHDRASDVTVFDSAELRNTWETRANQQKEKTEFENERRQKSALPQLFDQWHDRWTCRNGIAVTPEKKARDISEFRKVLELRPEDAEKSKPLVNQPRPRPQTIFSKPLIPPLPKIPPPKKRDPEARKPSSTPKPQPKLEPPPKREEVKLRKVPKSEQKQKEILKTEREKVVLSSIADKPSHVPTTQPPKIKVQEVQQNKLVSPSLRNWNNSWKYARPQPRQKIKTVKKKDTQFTPNRNKSIQLMESITYIETPSLLEWIESWKSLKNHFNQPKGQEFMLDEFKLKKSLFELEQKIISPTEWAESWKVLNLQLHQENEYWENGWSHLCRDFQCKKLHNSQIFNEQTSLFGWQESWKFLKSEPKQEKEHIPDGRSNESMALQPVKMKKLLLNWIDSWKLTNPQCYDDTLSLIEWGESWRSCSVQDTCSNSLDSCHSDVICMPKNIKSNGFSNFKIVEEKPSLSEWSESWKFPMSQDNKCQGKSELKEDIANPPLPLHSQKKTYSSKWKESWKFSNANDEKTSQSAWSSAWKLLISKSPEKVTVSSEGDTNTSSQLVNFQPYNNNNKLSMSDWNESCEKLSVSEWNESWKTIKPKLHENSEPESKPTESSYLQFNSKKVDLSDWNGSWKLSMSQAHSHMPSLSEWSDSWKLLNPDPHKKKESWSDKITFKDSLNVLVHMEKPSTSEWSDSWKIPKSSSPGSQINSENIPESEWGASWKFVNTQCNLEGVPWSKQDECDFPDNALTKNKLPFLSRGDRSSNRFDDDLQLCLTEWNESWKLLKTQSQEQHEARSK